MNYFIICFLLLSGYCNAQSIFNEVVRLYGSPPIIAAECSLIKELRVEAAMDSGHGHVEDLQTWLKQYDKLKSRVQRVKEQRIRLNQTMLPVYLDEYLNGNEKNLVNAVLIQFGTATADLIDDIISKSDNLNFYSNQFSFPDYHNIAAAKGELYNKDLLRLLNDPTPWHESFKLKRIAGSVLN